jgi:polyhydroxyalkanoate synthase
VTRPPLYDALAAARPGRGGCSDKEEVWRAGKATLHRYRSIAKPAKTAPLLIVYALVNRPYMMDLQPDRSLIRGLLELGIDVYLLDWGYPDGADRFITLADYIEELLHGAVEEILHAQNLDRLNLLGVCQGGVLSLCYGALHPERVRNLITMVTPVDFHTPADLLSKWARKIDIAAWVGDGNVSGDTLNQLFLSLMPFRLSQQKYVEFLRGAPDTERIENFMRMEQWIFDSPDQAGAAFREYVTWFYQENRLVQGRLEIGGRAVRLGDIKMPLLNLVGTRDHLVPPAASLALERFAAGRDVTTRQFDLGHIGMYVSARAQREVPSAIAQWLESR